MRVNQLAGLIGTCLVSTSLLSAPTHAQSGGRGDDVDVSTDDESFTAVYERPGGYTTGGGGGAVDCDYTRFRLGGSQSGGAAESGLAQDLGIETTDEDGTPRRSDPNGGAPMTLYLRAGADCANGFVWVSDSLTPESLIPGLRIEMTRVLPLPVPNMSPAPDVGSYVNLGLWIAIEDPGFQGVRISDGPVWGEAEGTLTGFTFDPGDGTAPFDCDLTGTPYVDGSQTLDEGPCGYTYTQRSPSGGTFPLTITANYDVTYVLSNGVTGGFGIIPRADGFPYDVDEIQTVGTGDRTI